MAMAGREQFEAWIDSGLLVRLQEIAAKDGKELDSVVEDALRVYITCRSNPKVRPEVMAHAWASLDKNRRLMELLAEHDSQGSNSR